MLNSNMRNETGGLVSAYQLTQITSSGIVSTQNTSGGFPVEVYQVNVAQPTPKFTLARDEDVRRSLERSISQNAEIWRRLANL